jgi:hypothetical protein
MARYAKRFTFCKQKQWFGNLELIHTMCSTLIMGVKNEKNHKVNCAC